MTKNKSIEYGDKFSKAINSFYHKQNGKISAFLNIAGSKEIKHEHFEFTPILKTITIPIQRNILTVNVNNTSDGLKSKDIVAIFPENFYGNSVKESDPVFYFINRFFIRHKSTTRLVLQKNFPNFLDNLFDSSFNEINTKTVTNWVVLHEYFHRTGHLPIPKFLELKSSHTTAGLEELRVDILSMLYCLENFNNKEYKKIFFLILSERMFTYPFIRHIKNYDSISSIVLFHNLKNVSSIEEIKFNLEKLAKRIEKIEYQSSISTNPKNQLLKLCMKLFDESAETLEMFELMKGSNK